MPNLEFPAFYDDDLVGVAAKAPIKHRDVLLGVPYSVLLTTEKALNDPVLKEVYSENPHVFSNRNEHHE